MELNDTTKNKIPPIIVQIIQNCFDPNLAPHVRDNYRDIIRNIRDLSDDAIKEFDKRQINRKSNRNAFGKL